MFEAFRPDGPFFTGFFKVVNVIFVDILWIIFCIPIFTAGCSTTAMYYTIQKCIKNNRDTVWRCFWSSFKSNFKQGSAMMLILLAIAAVFLLDIYVTNHLTGVGNGMVYLAMFFRILLIVLCVYGFWVFTYIARFEAPTRSVMLYSLVFAIRHLPSSLCIGVIGFAAVVLIMTFRPLILAVPSLAVLLLSMMLERVFRRYMSEEDKKLEDERNNNYRDDYAGKFAEMRKHQEVGQRIREEEEKQRLEERQDARNAKKAKKGIQK